MFLSNWLVFKIVLAAVTGLVDYPLAADVLLVYDNANKLYLDGNSIDYVSNVVLYKGETSYEIEGPNVIVGDEQKITASDAAADDEFGISVAISGDYAIVGAKYGDEASTSNAGAAYIFKHNGTSWSEQQIITASNPGTNNYFGESVSISGDYAIVGANRENGEAGAAYIFKRSGTSWSEQQKITASDAAGGDRFGWSVSISGDYAIVGASNEADGGANAGAAYIFKRNGTSWSQQSKLTASNAASGKLFGYSVGISGDYAIVGARGEGAYIFIRSGTSWSEQQSLTASDAAASDYFGWSTGISGDYAIVGAKYEDDGGANAGAAYIFKRNGTSWSQQSKLTASDAYDNDQFGVSVSISGDYVIVGARYEDDGGADAGATYIFKRSGTKWSQQQKLLASDAAASDEFGYSVGISGDHVIVGARVGDSTIANDSGTAYIYPLKEVTNYYITQPGTYRADLQICGIDYKTNEVEVTGTPTSSKVTQVSAGGFGQSMALTQDGSVYMWGEDTYGQMGQGTTDTNVNTPVKVKGVGGTGFLINITKISCGGRHCIALASDGTLYAWGDNTEGQIGDASTTERKTPVVVSYSGESISNISAGYLHSALTTTTGKVYCWGQGTNGQIGDNQSTSDRNVPTQVVGVNNIGNLTGIRDITCGDSFTYAIKDSDGSVYAWGKNVYGTLGDGTTTDRNIPVSVILASDSSAVTGIIQIISGGDHTVMLKSDGTVYACGYGANGQLGDGGTANNDTGLVQVLGVGGSGYLTGITQIATCDSTSLALKSDGTMYVWGNNADGQNGLGTVGGTNPTTPVAITTLTGVDTIGRGARSLHFIATKSDGSVYCWGQGSDGQIGDGNNTADVSTPTQVVAGAGPSVDGKFNLFTEPRLTFDNYNKFSILHGLSYTSSKLAYYSNVYDIGTLTSDLTIENPGEYTSLTFDTLSNVAYFSNATVGTVLDAPTTRAFFYGNFDDTFSDGDVTTAASNGRFYADMPETSTTFGTVSVTSSTSTSTTYQLVVPTELTGTNVLIVGGGGGGGAGQNSVHWPSGGGGGEVQNLTNQTISAGTYTIVVGNGGTNASGTNSSAFGTSANGGGDGNVGSGGTSGSGNGPGNNSGYNVGGGGGDASVGGSAGGSGGGSGGDGSNVSWLDGTVYGEQVDGKAYFGGGSFSGDYTGIQTNGKGNGLPGTGGGSYGSSQLADSGMVAIYSSVGLGIKYLDFDTYNKLSIENITPTSTTLKYGSNTYDLGTVTDVYIANPGTYEAAITASDKFALVSNVVGGTISFPSRTSYRYLALAFPRNNYENSLENMIIEFDDGTKFDNANQPVSSAFTQNYTPSTGATTDVFSTSQHTVWSGSSLGWSGGTWYCPFHIDCGSGFTKKVKRVTIINRQSDYQYTLIVPRLYGASSVPSTPGLAENWNYVCHVESIQRGWTSSYDMEPTAYRYIGLVGYRTKFSMFINEVSIELLDGTVYDGSNIPTVSSNMTFGSGTAANTIDGDFTTRSNWNSGSTYTDTSQQYVYLKVDLGSAKKVKHVRVWSDYTGSYENGTNSMNYYGSSTDTSSIDAEGSSDWNRLGPIEMLKSNDTTEQTINSSLYDSKLEFDGYNKLSLSKFDPTSTTLKYGSNTYDLGTRTDVYIAHPGTYSAEIKGATNFALVSNVVSGSIIEKPYNATSIVSWTNLGTTLTSDTNNITFSGYVDWDTTGTVSTSFDSTNNAIVFGGGNVGLQADFTSLRPDRNSNLWVEYEVYLTSGDMRSMLGIGKADGSNSDWFNWYDYRVYVRDANVGTGTSGNVPTGQWVKLAWKSDYIGSGDRRVSALLDSGSGYQEIAYHTGAPMNAGSNYLDDTGVLSYIRLFYTSGNAGASTIGNKIRNIHIFNDQSDVPTAPPSLTFDTYNKLSIENITPTSTTLKYDSNTYDIGTATDIYIANDGTYEIETKDANTFALASNTATYQAHPNATYSNYRSIGGISAASTSLHNENITTTYSVTMWAKKINGNYFFRTAPTDGNSAPYSTHGILRWVNSKIGHTTWTSNSSSGITYVTGLNRTTRDEWHFYGFEFEGTTTKLHLDGAAPITGSTGLLGQTHNRIRFDDPTIFSTGGARLAEFAVYNRALSDAEFVSIYNNGLPNGPDNVSSGRVSWFKCLSGAMGTNSGTGGDFDASFTEDTDVPSAWLDPTPSLAHDTYNKLSINNINFTASTLRLGSNTYDIGTATNIYVEDYGTYEIETKDVNTFALASNVVSSVTRIEPGFASRYYGLMAITYDGKLYAWGMNDDGEAGVNTSSSVATPTLCTGITQGTVAKLLSSSDLTDSTRAEVSAIKTTDGKIYMTGKGDTYMIPGTTSDLLSFTDVTSYFGDQSLTANNVTTMSFTDRSGAALTETGNVWTWGTHDTTYKALGQANASSSSTPKQINFGGATGTITKITCGHYHSLALDSNGDVWFWGKNGINSDSWPSSITDEPQKVVDAKNIIGIASSFGTMYTFDSTGKMWNAGNNWEGQIGDGTTTANTTGKTLTEVTYFSSNGITINKVYGGASHVFADTSDGWYCWGNGGSGAFGNGGTGNLASPTKWTNVSNIKVFTGGTNMGAAITEDGKYYAWGAGGNYARGDNTTGNISYPKYIDTLPNILAPSFEFDGYDKVFAHMKPSAFVYEFYISVKLDGGSQNEWHSYGITTTSGTLTQSMLQIHPPLSAGELSDMFNGSYTSGTLVRIPDGYHEVGTKIMTLTTPFELADITFYVYRPYYQPGYKITCNGEIVLEETTNGGTASTPSPTSFTKTLSPITMSLTKYTKDTHTYDANQAQIVTVSDPGTYNAQLSQGSVFTLTSETIPSTKTTGLYTWAFHHGNFDNAYGDGDILTARDNGRFYADTPSYTGDIGTITANPNINSYTYTVSFKVINQSGTTIYDGTDGSIQFTMTEGVEYDTRNDLSTALDDAIDTALSGGPSEWSVHGFRITSSTGFICNHAGTSYDTHTYTLGTLKTFHSRNGGSVNVLITNPYYSQTTYTFTPASTLTANVLMVAGGGGGAYKSGGAGGAGGLVYTSGKSLSGNTTIVVGNGGEEGINGSTIGYKGKDTSFTDNSTSTIAYGGGGGCSYNTNNTDKDGGSGGGGASGGTSGSFLTGGTGTTGQGNAGGDSQIDPSYREGGGGGGGAGTAGSDAVVNDKSGGDGGKGLYYGNVFGVNYGEKGWFAGGGGGGARYGTQSGYGPGTPGLGGLGGGGSALTEESAARKDNHGMNHTGGGGGGGAFDEGNYSLEGGAGGSGIVLLQTDVATPNVNSEVKVPEPDLHGLIQRDDDTQFSYLPNGIGVGSSHGGGSIVSNIPRADGSVSNVYYATSSGSFHAQQAGSLVSTVEGIFYPVEQERYDNILEIGHNSTDDVELEMAADGTAKLYRNNGGNLIAAGTITCFTAGKWHHIALTLDTGGNAVGYVNGYPVVSGTYASAILPGSRTQMYLYRTGVTATFRKFLMYYFKTYNSVLNQKQIMALAGTAGLGPKLEYDGLNSINVVNIEKDSEITIYESNVNDTSNLYVVSCNESSYLLSNAGTYYAQIKGTDTFTITRPLTITDDHFPLYQYPPVATGTLSNGTFEVAAGPGNQSYFTVSGAETGNGTYSSYSSVAAASPGSIKADSSGVFTNIINASTITYTNQHYNFFLTTTTSNVDLVVILPSAKTIRKYVLYPTDSNAPTSPYEPGSSVNPVLEGNTNENNLTRPKSWTLYGYTQNTGWVSLDTVTNQPPSIYGDVHSISSPASYDQYKLSISENNGSTSYIQLGEWQLWGDA